MATYSKQALLANIFGTFGYVSTLFQWLLVALLYLPLLLNNDQIKLFLLPEKTQYANPVASTTTSSPLLIGFALLVTISMLVVTIILLVRAPASIAKTGKNVTAKTASRIIPLVVHHPLSPAKKRQLTSQLVKVLKLSLILIPFGLCAVSLFVETALPTDVVMFASAIMAITSLAWFCAQYLSARWLKIKHDALV